MAARSIWNSALISDYKNRPLIFVTVAKIPIDRQRIWEGIHKSSNKESIAWEMLGLSTVAETLPNQIRFKQFTVTPGGVGGYADTGIG